ncbi:RNA polymerase sigma factor 54 interaction domain protein [Acididesulfobacillus acetoxydans]|uniref:Acetoacetate metabolism regulatory protein AtoC n=1 Tax=Acididesulfobacillus acetoxydans TaxID=1561005 RepID=A0A8S0X764_9FIRM|nr:sigma 54-interacting transcriptional regulator [Acididesulfobacillus acetoxydans]CAA7603060.1 RNA polymerase sigma factor 54 interaction domain protein [Acididesulfobacillus acetoxydans]CEJ08713.1 Acetoacetate metabolism regulatory protein AtoC [Acididesulfobacillus acetoxydans]
MKLNIDAKIMLIAPYIELAEEATRLNLESNLDVKVKNALLAESGDLISKAKKEQMDAIVSRGGIALKLSQGQHDIPVIEIPISGFDILEALYEGMKISHEIALMGFSNIIEGANRVALILSLSNLRVVLRETADDCIDKVALLKKQGVQVIIGDSFAVKTAIGFGLKGILIRSSRESLIAAYQEASRIVRIKRDERLQQEQLRTILNYTHSGIIAVDKHGFIIAANTQAEKLIGKKHNEIIRKPCMEIAPSLNLRKTLEAGKTELGLICDMAMTRVVVSRVPIVVNEEVVGAVATLEASELIQEVHRKLHKEIIKKGHFARNTFDSVLGRSKIIKAVIAQAKAYSSADSAVLIQGETGVGKELFAQAIHNQSPRCLEPFIAFNCAAIPTNLLESELFGYVGGAFTDARKEGKVGLLEMAEGGTVFLDEIGEITPEFQVKLLRALQEREIMRIGDGNIIKVNIRVIASTNKDLRIMVEEGRFRADLYYRLNVLRLKIPPLREREGDIPLLAKHFLQKHCEKYRKPVLELSPAALSVLNDYNWPGNIRELSSVIERAAVRSPGIVIDANEFYDLADEEVKDEGYSFDRRLLIETMLLTGGNKTQAAALLGVDRSTLWRRLKKLEGKVGKD